jgi:sulfate transport system permease protein
MMQVFSFAPFVRTRRSVLPGYRASMAATLIWLSVIVLVPLMVLLVSASHISADIWLETLRNERVQAAFLLSMQAAFGAACIATLLGVLVAWVLTRYRFFGRGLLDALVDIPFALPTAIAGIALSAVYAPDGAIGGFLQQNVGIELVFNRTGIWLALVFIGLPFVVRSVQPVLGEIDRELEEAAASLGANRIQIFVRVLFPLLRPAILSGFALALARGFGEYGSVIFLAGNVPYVSEIVPLAIVTALESYQIEAATIMATLMLGISFAMLYLLNMLQHHSMHGARR